VVRAMMTVARLGARTSVISMVGDDSSGRSILNELETFSVDTSEIQASHESATRRSHAWLSREVGSRTIVYAEDGPMLGSLTNGAIELIKAASVLHLDGREFELAKVAARTAKACGALVSIDTGSPKADLEELLGYVNVAIVPIDTLAEIGSSHDMNTCVQSLISKTTDLETVIVTQGKERQHRLRSNWSNLLRAVASGRRHRFQWGGRRICRRRGLGTH
jgi:sulfofructose kinase